MAFPRAIKGLTDIANKDAKKADDVSPPKRNLFEFKLDNDLGKLGEILLAAGSIQDATSIEQVSSNAKFILFYSEEQNFPCLHIVATDVGSYGQLDQLLSNIEAKEKNNFCAMHDISSTFLDSIRQSSNLTAYQHFIYSIPFSKFSVELINKSLALASGINTNTATTIGNKINKLFEKTLQHIYKKFPSKDDVINQTKAFLAKKRAILKEARDKTPQHTSAIADEIQKVDNDEKLIDDVVSETNAKQSSNIYIYGTAALIYEEQSIPLEEKDLNRWIAHLCNIDSEDSTPITMLPSPAWVDEKIKIRSLTRSIETEMDGFSKQVKNLRGSLGEQQRSVHEYCLKIKLPSLILLNDQGTFVVNNVYDLLLINSHLNLKHANQTIEKTMSEAGVKQLHAHIREMNANRNEFIPISFISSATPSLCDVLYQPLLILCEAPTYKHQQEDGLDHSIKTDLQDLFENVTISSDEKNPPSVPDQNALMKLIGTNFHHKYTTSESSPSNYMKYGNTYNPGPYLESWELGVKCVNEMEDNELKESSVKLLFNLYRSANFSFAKDNPCSPDNNFLVIPRTALEFLSIIHTMQSHPELQQNAAFKKKVTDKFLPQFERDIQKGIYPAMPNMFINFARDAYSMDSQKLKEMKNHRESLEARKKEMKRSCRDNTLLLIKESLRRLYNPSDFKQPDWTNVDIDLTYLYSSQTGSFENVSKELLPITADFIRQTTKGEDFTLEQFQAFKKQNTLSSGTESEFKNDI